jgi:hypothetical protein
MTSGDIQFEQSGEQKIIWQKRHRATTMLSCLNCDPKNMMSGSHVIGRPPILAVLRAKKKNKYELGGNVNYVTILNSFASQNDCVIEWQIAM